MKFILALLLVLLPSLAFAGPFLVSDANPVGDGVLRAVYVETTTSTQCTAADVLGKPRVPMPDVANAIRYDMTGVTTGTHFWCVAQVNVWDESPFVPLVFERKRPAAPANTRIVEQ